MVFERPVSGDDAGHDQERDDDADEPGTPLSTVTTSMTTRRRRPPRRQQDGI
jgi:hypothetical protein